MKKKIKKKLIFKKSLLILINIKKLIKMKKFLFIIASIIVFNSCNTEKKNVENTDLTPEKDAVKEVLKGKYALKSGIIEIKATVMGMTQKHILIFDDYGNKESTELKAELMGIKTHQQTFSKDGYVYTIDLLKKTGVKMQVPVNSSDINWENLGEEMTKSMNIKRVGNEDFMGKTCDKYTIDDKKTGMKGYYLIWKGLALKTDVMVMGMKTVLEVTKIEENATISPDKFEVPQGIKITEQQMPKMQ